MCRGEKETVSGTVSTLPTRIESAGVRIVTVRVADEFRT